MIVNPTHLKAVFEHKGSGGMYSGAGSSGIASEENAFAVIINPAKLAFTKNTVINLSYRNFYLISGLDQISLASQFSLGNIPIGLSIDRFGNKLYSEYTLSAGSAIRLFDSLSIGYNFNIYHLKIKNYNQAATVGFSISALYKVNSSFRTGFIYENISESTLGNSSERLPINLALAFSFNPISRIELNFDIFKDNQFDFEYRAGLYYAFNDYFKLMAGFRSSVNSYSAGMRINKYNFNLIYAFIWHSELGISNSLGVGYEL
jgi:hypothetical protein